MSSEIMPTKAEPSDRSILKNLAASSAGRLVGLLLLCQLVAALTLPFILTKAVTVGSPAFLTAVSEQSFQIRFAVLLAFAGSALTIWLGICMFEVLRVYSQPVGILLLIVCSISCIMDLVHTATILSMLSISNSFLASGGTNTELYQVVGSAVASVRRSAHITQLVGIAAWMFVFYTSMLRFKLIPPVLAGAGVIGVILQFTGVTLMMILGNRPIAEMALPLLPIEITVGTWLIIKGFNNSASLTRPLV